MLRWHDSRKSYAEIPAADAFLSDLAEVCRKHGLNLSHEDQHGAFEIILLEGDGEPDFVEAHWMVE